MRIKLIRKILAFRKSGTLRFFDLQNCSFMLNELIVLISTNSLDFASNFQDLYQSLTEE